MRARRIFRNTIVSLAGQGFGDLCGLVFLAIFARLYGSDVLGEFWYAMAFGTVLGIFISRGTTPVILREASQKPDMTAKYIGAAASLQLLIAIVLVLLVAAFSPFIADSPRASAILVIICVYQFGYTLALVFRTYFNAQEEMHFNAILESGHKILILVGGLVALALFDAPEYVLLIYPLAALAIYVAGYTLVTRRYKRPALRMRWRLNWHWSVVALPVFAYGLLRVLANRSGIIALGHVSDATTVGIFAAGDRLVVAFGMPFVMFTGAVFPVMSKLTKSPSELREFVQTCLRVVTVAAVPLTGLIIIYREPIVALVFGEIFRESASILGVLSLSIVFVAMNSMLSMLLVATDDLWALFRIMAISLVVLFAGIVLTLGDYGPIGLAASVVASNAAAAVGLLAFIRRDPLGVKVKRSISCALATAIAMTLAFYALYAVDETIRNASTILIGAVSLVLFRGVERDDIRRLREILGK